MTILFKTLLGAHVVLGVVGLTGVYMAWMALLSSPPRWVRASHWALTGFLGFFSSWLFGGYYYVVYYGASVKPKILSGSYPWAHKFFMEAKEHIFLFLPFLALALWLICRAHGKAMVAGASAERSARLLAGVATILATMVTAAGVIISGSVR